MTIFRLIALFVFLFESFACRANIASPNFYRNLWSPTYHTQQLSYCSYDGKECGMPVATHYCRMLGYQKAVRVIEEHNVGLSNYLATRAQCRGWKCNGFRMIRCVGKFSHKPPQGYYYRSRRFVYPRFDHYRVDWCYKRGKECGKRVAYSFCRRMGYRYEKGYKKQSHVPATKMLGSQELCFGEQCQAFRTITCYR